MNDSAVSQNEIKEKILNVLSSNDAIMIATTGGEYSPWILGAYFVSDDIKIYLLLEKAGKSFANVKLNPNVAISISKNDATQDFLQACGKIEILPDEEEANVRKMLLSKMPWYMTYTPVAPVRINVSKFFITSIANGWFPAKTLEIG
jgi:nitroimidazol reductase NimA-like FMN-containing flavoprotein (pyridoxamine 5'-phosphate oxidase superfamily)